MTFLGWNSPLLKHDQFAQTLRDAGVEVLYLSDLVSEALDTNPAIKKQFIQQFIKNHK